MKRGEEAMEKRPIKRAVVELDTSNQLSLFVCGDEETGEHERSGQAKAPRFKEPDPRDIQLNGVRLDEHLKRMGERSALRVRELLQSLSWSEFESVYRAEGRRGYAPRLMVGLILYGIMKGISSLRDLEQLARTDLGCMWVSGGIMPDHSIIGRFVQRHEACLTETLFSELTGAVLKATRSDTQTVSGDATVIEAAVSRYQVVKQEALAKALDKARRAAEEQPAQERHQRHVERLCRAEQALQSRQAARRAKGKAVDKVSIAPGEPEAVVQPLKDNKRFAPSYKPSVLATELRIILAQAVDASSETGVVAQMLDQAARHGPIKQALFDAGYHADAVLKASAQREIELLCPEGQSQGEDWTKRSDKYYPKSRFHYDDQRDSYRCPQGHELRCVSAYKGNERYPGYALYGSEACRHCPQRSHCTKNVQGRRIKRYDSDGAKEALRRKMEQPQVRERYRRRQGMVEPVFSQLKCRQGLRRFRRRGLTAVRCEFALHAMAYNLSRAAVLWRRNILSLIRWLQTALTACPLQRRKRLWSRLTRSIPRQITIGIA